MTRDEIISLISSKIEGQGNQVDLGGTLPRVLKGLLRPYISLERVRDYLYRVTFDSLAKDKGLEDAPAFGCSSYVENGRLYRNLDFRYDNSASFIVRYKGVEGMSFITGLNDENLDDELIAQLPYCMTDGVNTNGIKVTTHILFNDWGWKGVGEKSIPLTRIPFLVLNKVKSMATIEEDLGDILGNVATTSALEASDYLLQFLVTDGATTYAILPPLDKDLPYVLQDISANPKLANFRWVEDEEVDRRNLQLRPSGVERFNLMPCPLADLRFTLAYESNGRLSEFIGEGGTTKDSSDAQLEVIYNKARALYLARERNGETWQTMHSVIYEGNKMDALFVQEDWADNCVGESIANQIGDLATLDTDHKSTLVEAINELADLIETQHFVISFSKTNEELKNIYEECKANLNLAKNIVFYNANDNLYYRVNGFNMVNNVLKLHAIMGTTDTTINLASNGSLSIG